MQELGLKGPVGCFIEKQPTGLFGLLGTYLYLAGINYKYVYIGVITGLNTMVKPYFPHFALAIILTDFLYHKKLWKSIKNGAVVLLVTGLIIAPWLYRNYKLIGEYTYVSNNAGIVLYINNNTQNKLSGWMLAEDVENSVVNRPDYHLANPTQKNIMLSRYAREWIMGHPREFVSLGLRRLSKTFIQLGDIDYAFQGSGLLPLLQVIMFSFSEFVRIPVFLGGVASIFIHTLLYIYLTVGNRLTKKSVCFDLNFNGGKGRLFLIITFFMFAGVYFITEGQSRYAFPTVLSLTVYAVIGIEAVKRLRG